MTATEALARGRAAFQQDVWSEAYIQLAAADRLAPLEPEDLDLLATAAYLVGEDAASTHALTRAHHGYLERGETVRAARSAFCSHSPSWTNPASRRRRADGLRGRADCSRKARKNV